MLCLHRYARLFATIIENGDGGFDAGESLFRIHITVVANLKRFSNIHHSQEIKMAPAAKAYLISGFPRSMRDVVEYSDKVNYNETCIDIHINERGPMSEAAYLYNMYVNVSFSHQLCTVHFIYRFKWLVAL